MEPLTIAYLLIALGLGLLVAELFIPSSGMLFLASSVCIVAGVAMTFIYGDTSTGMVTLLSVFVAIPVVAALMFYFWPRTPLGRRLVLPDQDSTIATMPVNLELENLRGRLRTMSDEELIIFSVRRLVVPPLSLFPRTPQTRFDSG